MTVERGYFVEGLGCQIPRDLKGMVLNLSTKAPDVMSKFLKNQSTHKIMKRDS